MTVAFVIPSGNKNFPFDNGLYISVSPFLLTFKCKLFFSGTKSRAIDDLRKLDAVKPTFFPSKSSEITSTMFAV